MPMIYGDIWRYMKQTDISYCNLKMKHIEFCIMQDEIFLQHESSSMRNLMQNFIIKFCTKVAIR